MTEPSRRPTPPTLGPPPPYDAQCGAVLATLRGFPPLTRESIPELREAEFMPVLTDEMLTRDGAFILEEHAAPGPDGAPDVPLLVCRPSLPSGPVPVLYTIHGGGMVAGSAREAMTFALNLAEEVGAAVVSVEYRLAPETPHPGPVEDCYAGLLWVFDNAGPLGFDAAHVVVNGGSAGGGLAAAVALLCRDRGGPVLAGQLLSCPMLDDRNDSPSIHQLADLPMWNRASNEVGWTALLGEARGGADVSPYAAPARATDLAGLPPAFVDVGSVDSFRDEDIAYASAIWRAGGVAELHVWPGGYHGFDGIAPDAAVSRDAAAARADWLRRLIPLSAPA